MRRIVKISSLVLITIAITAISVVSASSSITVDSGIKESTVPMSTEQLATPPVGFVLLTASDAELARYGLPPRPTDPGELQAWNITMASAKTYIPTTTTVGTAKFGTTEKNASKWCGYELDPTKNKVGTITPTVFPGITWARIKVPNTIQTGNAIATFWTGFNDGIDIIQAGFGVGTAIPKQGGSASLQIWMENWPSTCVWVNGFPISLGDTIYVSVNAVNKSWACITWIDETKGTCTSQWKQITQAITPQWAKVEYIYENYQGTNAPPPYWGITKFWDCQFRSVVGSTTTFPYFDQWNNYRYTMTISGHTYATASPISHGFTVTSYK